MAQSNTAIWNALYQSDPAHVKKITGKTYQGDSPKPHWMIKRLTEQFGPVGRGFGWEVISSEYIDSIPRPDGREKRHECRILFWWRDDSGRHEVESFGGTKALYKAGIKDGAAGYWVDDEDAAKKSLTDAITKAASWLGLAGDIFMGQWNDSKYQTELRVAAKTKKSDTPESGAAARDDVAGDDHHNPREEPPHDPRTGEIVPPTLAESATSGLRDAWLDGIKDALPADYTPRQMYEGIASALELAFAKMKSPKGLEAQWNKRSVLIEDMRLLFEDIYSSTLDAYTANMDRFDAFGLEPVDLKSRLEQSVALGDAR